MKTIRFKRLLVRFNQGSQKVVEAVQPRPTCAEKVRRLEAAPLLGSSNRLTSSNLTAHTHAHTRAYTRAHARLCALIQVRQVRRLDSNLILMAFFRPTFQQQVRRISGGWT
jgi:hypothetical protein